ncbi:MAG TPA: thiolase family protein [Steroidobacteraceae bacterium]
MALRDNVIVGFAEAKNVWRSGRDVWEFAAEVLEQLLEQARLTRDEVDGLILGPSLTGASTAFWQQSTLDYLGLEPQFADTTDLGGCSAVGSIARAAAALDAGLCETVILINADTPSTEDRLRHRSFVEEWAQPYGYTGPPAAFGLLSRRYEHQYGLDIRALAKLAVTQRAHAMLNPNAVDKLRKPITESDYLNSRLVADPIRLLDCVMPCDGANGFVMMSRTRAVTKGYSAFVVPLGYGEQSNYQAMDNCPDITRVGHQLAGRRAFARAGIRPRDIASLHPYDDFLIAILLCLESLGFCKPGEGAAFVRETNLMFNGDLPLNTSGGQISAGQAGLAGGGTNLVEAVRQLLNAGGERQIANRGPALVTGIGWLAYARNWGTSVALILAADA